MMSNTIEISLSLKVRNIFGGGGFKAKMNLFQSKVSSSIEVQNSVIQTGMNLKEKIKLFGSINKNNQNNDLRKSSTVIIKNNNEFNSVKIEKEKEKTPEKKNINNIQDKNEEKNREKKLDLKKEISKVKINKNENIKKEEKININANKNNEKKQENKISNINNKDIKKEQIKKEIPIKKENIEKIKEKVDNKTKEIKKEKIGNKSEIKNLEKPKASQIIKKQELIKDKEEKKITENKSNNKFNNKEIQKKETNNIPKIEKKGDKEKNKGMANPKVIEKKVDEKTKVIEKKVEEKPKAIEKKVEEKPKVIEKKVEEKPKVIEKVIEKKIEEKSKVIEKKVEEKPKVIEKKVEEKPKIVEEKVEEKPKIVEEKVEEKPKVVEKKVEEKPKVVEKKSNIVINNDKKEQEKIEGNKKGEINEEKNLGEEYKKKEEVVQEDIKKEEEEIDKNIENEEVNKEKNENEEINAENVDNSEDEWEVIEKTKNEVINKENIENNETKEVKEENVEENVNGEVKKEHFEENVNEEVNEENVEENVNEEVNEENVEENEEVNDENVEEEENEENNEEKDEEMEEQEEIEDNPDENEEENVEENLEEAQNEENEEQYDDNNENVEEKENEEKEEINEEVNNEEKEKEEENEEINDEENNQEVEENIEENNVDNTYEENNTEIKMENNDENDISPKENIENKDSLNQENITDEETYLDEYPYNDEWEYNDNSNEVEIDSDNIYEEIEEKEEENNIESYELETPKEKEDENNIPEEKQEIKEIKEENDSNTNQTNKENIEGDTPNQKNISDNNINENIEKEKEKEDNNNKEENKLDLDIPKEINKKKRLTEIHNPKKKKIVADLGFEILDNFDNSPQSSSTIETAKDSTNQEILLESIDYESYLTKINQYGKKEISHETFCSGFFLASFPKKNGQVIENLSKFPSSCGHKECSELPPMKPEIIFRYPLKDTKDLELNNLAATICFPTGIKTCYSEEALPEKIEDYVTQITNQKGERYYMRTFHFYEKMSNIDFAKNYEITPLKNHLSKFADEYTFLKDEQYTEEITKNIQKNLKFCENLGFRDIVYIPCCLCLISKYPYINELGKCLETIYSVIAAKPGLLNFEINDLIMYLINSIPVPGKNMKIEFFIPHCINPKIELQCPKIDDISIMNSNYMGIFKYLSIDNIVLIFRLILAEKKLLFIHNDYTELTNITNSFISLLYPFQWIHTYIPIMSAQMLKYIETFLPFLNGIHISLMNFVEKVFKEGDNDETEEIFLIYIKNNEIVLSSSFKKKGIKLSKYIQSNIPNLPFEKELKKELKIIESSKKQIKKDFLENKLRDAFINIFVKMFYDYEKYIMNLDNDIVFNKVLFMKNIPNKEEKTEQFYEEFIDSQLFQQFTQNLTDKENSYFQKKIKEFKEKENKSNKKAERERTMSKIINKKDILYLAFPYIGLDLDNSEQNKEDINKLESIIEKYKVIPEETPEIKDKILENNIVIKEEAYINNKCIIYLNPDKEDFMKEEQNKNKKIEKKISMAEKQLDQIKDNIKDTVVNIFTSNIEKSQIKSLKKKVFSNLETPSGREFFVSLISNNKNKVISLQENSFFFLGELIKGILNSVLKSEETEELLEEIVKLILSTKYFETGVKTNSKHTKEAKKTIFKCMSKFLHGYSKITQKNLWKKWYDLELIRKKEECSDEDEIKQEVILDICKNMIYFQISKSVVKNVTESINKNAFEEGSELYEKVKKEYINLIIKAKYISEASK